MELAKDTAPSRRPGHVAQTLTAVGGLVLLEMLSPAFSPARQPDTQAQPVLRQGAGDRDRAAHASTSYDKAHQGPVKLGDGLDEGGKGLIYTIRRTYNEMMADRVLSVGGGVAFFALLALFPGITAVISLFGLIASPLDIAGMLQGLTGILPADAAALLADQAAAIAATANTKLSVAVTISVALALWSAMGGTKALIESLNVACGVTETRSFLRVNLLALAITVGAILVALGLAAAVAVLPAVLDRLWLGRAADFLVLWGRWPVMLGVFLLTLAVLYRRAPNLKNTHFRWVTPGAFVAAIGLLAFSAAFGWYASNFANYNKTYGSLGAAVALLTWVWLSTVIVLIGAEVNSELDRQAGLDKV